LVHLETARILFKEYAAEPHGIGSNNLNDRDPGNQIEFVVGAMAYWEAMASFLFDQRLEDLNYLLLSCDHRDEQFIRPNPWSGISDRLFIYMAQAGALSRQKVLTNKISRYISAAARDEIMSKQHQEASELVQRLMHFKPPNRHYIQDPGDKRTPLAHLLRLAHIYKLSILLQLYVSFPNLVATDGKDLVGEEIPNARQQHSDEPRHNLIITLAITILNIMATIPEDSRINAFLTLPLIIAGSVLQPCRTASDYHNSETIYSAPDLVSTIDQEIRLTNMTDCIIDHWRSVVRNRLEIMHSFVALDPIARARQLLELVWIKADIASYNGQWMGSGLSGMTHWMEVMIEERLESIFG
jgi:hypothetical protein